MSSDKHTAVYLHQLYKHHDISAVWY